MDGKNVCGRTADSQLGELAEGVDLVPTILDFCGVQTPRYVQGASLAGLLTGRTQTHRDSALSQHFLPGGSGSAVLRTRDHKYMMNNDGGEMLFDLAADPHELKNVTGLPAMAEILSHLRRELLLRLQSQYRRINRITQY